MSSQQFNDILKQVELLSSEEKLNLVKLLIEQTQPSTDSSRIESIKRSQQWIDEHRNQYSGQWVLLDGDHLVASAKTDREVLIEARKEGIKSPFLAFIEPIDALPFGGW